MVHPTPGRCFEEQMASITSAMEYLLAEEFHGAEPLFIRYFLSDAANQEAAAKESAGCFNCAVSVVEQPPLDGTKVSAWMYLVRRSEQSAYGHMWHGTMTADGADSCDQTDIIFRNYADSLDKQRCTIQDNCIRTWLFVQNVDVNYAGVVKGRREYFDTIGLTPETHYIASTGIAGRTASAASSVMMDAYAVSGLHPDQVTYVKGSTHLNPTHEYGVTFERGTAVRYGDRQHVFISGTASIDNTGAVVHPGDIQKQTLRMLENVDVLLSEVGCGFEDAAHMIVYLRDIADYTTVRNIFETRFPDHPKIFLWAPVCRPGWLVEMECIAVAPVVSSYPNY